MTSWTSVFMLPLTVALSAIAPATGRITPPNVPMDIEAPAGFKPFFVAHAVGTQNYICAPAATASGVDWLFVGPQATLFDANGDQVATHFQSRNPLEGDALHATWQHSRDSSAAWGKRHSGSTDANYVAPGAIEWLLLDVTGQKVGPNGGDKLTKAAYIQRVNTVGGIKPAAAECTAATVNTRRLVSYEADYYFYQ